MPLQMQWRPLTEPPRDAALPEPVLAAMSIDPCLSNVAALTRLCCSSLINDDICDTEIVTEDASVDSLLSWAAGCREWKLD